MQRYLAGRMLQAIISMLVVSMVVFVLARLTGDPLEIMMPAEATKEDIAMMRAYLGLDRPWPIQYWWFISRAVQGDWGIRLREVHDLSLDHAPAPGARRPHRGRRDSF